MKKMKGLIIRDPHISEILDGRKTWEMRSQKTKIRGRIGLIKGGSGCVYGEADLVDVLDPLETDLDIEKSWEKHRVDDFSLLKKWRYPWKLENVEIYEKPIPYNHPSGAVIWVNL